MEVVDILIPLLYGLTFAAAYYGPNASILGNVKNSYWRYEEATDVPAKFIKLLQMLSVDICSLVVTGFAFWTFCKINYLQEICKVLNKYWFIIAIKFSTNLAARYSTNDINWGMDYTYDFDWITEDGRLRFIRNSTGLSDEGISYLLQNTTAK